MPPPSRPAPVTRRRSCISGKDASHVVTLVWEGERHELALTTPEYMALLKGVAEALESASRVATKRIPERAPQSKNSAARWWAHRNGYVLPHHNHTPPEIIELWKADGAPEPERAIRRAPDPRRRLRKPELLPEIVKDYLAGYSLQQIAAKYGVDRKWTSRQLDALGVPKRSGGWKGHREAAAIRQAIRTEADRKAGIPAKKRTGPKARDIIEDYTVRDMGLVAIGAKYGIHHETVRALLKRNGIPIRPRGAPGHRGPLQAGNIAKTHCPKGHPYDEENTGRINKRDGKTERYCRICRNTAKQRSRARKRALSGSAAETDRPVEADVATRHVE